MLRDLRSRMWGPGGGLQWSDHACTFWWEWEHTVFVSEDEISWVHSFEVILYQREKYIKKSIEIQSRNIFISHSKSSISHLIYRKFNLLGLWAVLMIIYDISIRKETQLFNYVFRLGFQQEKLLCLLIKLEISWMGQDWHEPFGILFEILKSELVQVLQHTRRSEQFVIALL